MATCAKAYKGGGGTLELGLTGTEPPVTPRLFEFVDVIARGCLVGIFVGLRRQLRDLVGVLAVR